MAWIEPVTDSKPFQNGWIDKLFEAIPVKAREMQMARARRSLESKLEKHVLLAEGYRKNGLVPFHQDFYTLASNIRADVSDYCSKWNIPEAEILRDNPGIQPLMNPPPVPPLSPMTMKVIQVLMGSILGLIALGMAAGVVASSYHWVVTHFAR